VSTDDVDLSTVAEDEETARAQIDKMEEEGPPEDLADCPTGYLDRAVGVVTEGSACPVLGQFPHAGQQELA
jgi:hypothetical protein